MSEHFGFAKLVVGDLDKSAKFYEAVAELKSQVRINTTIAGREITEIVYEATGKGGANFVLFAYHDTPKTPAGEMIIGFVTTDIAAFLERVRKNGGSVTVEPFETSSAGAMKVAFAADPDGHVIEVIQPL
jgi:predicted enzyme related to lactoylglutathione lyase